MSAYSAVDVRGDIKAAGAPMRSQVADLDSAWQASHWIVLHFTAKN